MNDSQFAVELLTQIRKRQPLIHHLANFVTMHNVAMTTRVIGALPIMAMAPEEVEEIAADADALVVNLGTPTQERLKAMALAVRVARDRGIPIVVDPVGVGVSHFRTDAATQILKGAGRAIVRANRAEAAALVGMSAVLKGVESVSSEGDAVAVALALARRMGVAAVTGARDTVTDGNRMIAVDNGHPWLRSVVGAGDMATAAVGAFCAVTDSSEWVAATAAGLGCFGLAAERAAPRARGPGSLVPIMWDELFGLTPAEVRLGIRCTDMAVTNASA